MDITKIRARLLGPNGQVTPESDFEINLDLVSMVQDFKAAQLSSTPLKLFHLVGGVSFIISVPEYNRIFSRVVQ